MSTSNAPVANWAEIAEKQEQIIMKVRSTFNILVLVL